MKIAVVKIAASLVVLLALSATAKTKQDKVDEANWQQAQATNTIEAYSQYLQKPTSAQSPHQEEARQRLKSLVQADLASTKEVAVTFQATDAVGQRLMTAGLKKVVVDALEKQGYHVVEGDSQDQVVVSVSQNAFLSGTASSYWHFSSMTEVNVTFSKRGIGPVFTNEISGGPMNTEKEVRSFPSLRVKPVDDEGATYVNPDTGEAFGRGVEFVMASSDPAVIAADKAAFDLHDWAATVDGNAALENIRKALGQSPPLSLGDSTKWAF